MALSKIRNDSLADTAVHGRRNMFYNGALQVWQRGTSETGLTSGNNFLADRFKWKITSAGTWSQERSTETPNNQFQYSWKATCTTADTTIGSGDQLRLIYTVENQDMLNLGYGESTAKKATLSFWIKCSKAATYAVTIESASGRNYTTSYTVNTADTWEHKTITINGDTANTLSGNPAFSWWFQVGTNYDGSGTTNAWYTDADYSDLTGGVTTNLADTANAEVYLTGIQFEVGEQATPFEHRSYGEELQSCLRYCEVVTVNGAYHPTGLQGFVESSTRAKVTYPFRVPMRAAPSFTRSGSYYYDGASGNPTFSSNYGNAISKTMIRIEDSISGGTTGQGVLMIANNDINLKLIFDAEL